MKSLRTLLAFSLLSLAVIGCGVEPGPGEDVTKTTGELQDRPTLPGMPSQYCAYWYGGLCFSYAYAPGTLSPPSRTGACNSIPVNVAYVKLYSEINFGGKCVAIWTLPSDSTTILDLATYGWANDAKVYQAPFVYYIQQFRLKSFIADYKYNSGNNAGYNYRVQFYMYDSPLSSPYFGGNRLPWYKNNDYYPENSIGIQDANVPLWGVAQAIIVINY